MYFEVLFCMTSQYLNSNSCKEFVNSLASHSHMLVSAQQLSVPGCLLFFLHLLFYNMLVLAREIDPQKLDKFLLFPMLPRILF